MLNMRAPYNKHTKCNEQKLFYYITQVLQLKNSTMHNPNKNVIAYSKHYIQKVIKLK